MDTLLGGRTKLTFTSSSTRGAKVKSRPFLLSALPLSHKSASLFKIHWLSSRTNVMLMCMIEVPYKYFIYFKNQPGCVCVCCQPDDAVYLSDESLLQEYVINEDGAMYMGTWDNIQCIPWNYGQVTITHKTPQTPTCWVWRTYNPVSAKWRKVDFFQFWWVQGPFPNSWYLFTLPWSCLLRSLGKLCCTQSCNVHVRQVSKGIPHSSVGLRTV